MNLNDKIKELKPTDLNCNVFNVYDYNGLSMQELLCQFFNKINECVKTSNDTIDLTEYLVNEGLELEVIKKLKALCSDGTIKNIINAELFNELNKNTVKKGCVNINDLDEETRQAILQNNNININYVLGQGNVKNDNIYDGAITPNKTNFIKYGKNLLDLTTMSDGYLKNDGTLASGNYKTTPFIEFKNTDRITLSRMDKPNLNTLMTRRSIRKACFYDSNYKLISDYVYDNNLNLEEIVSYKGNSNISYIRVSLGIGFLDGLSMLYLGEELENFEDVELIIDKLKSNKVNNLYGKKLIVFGDSIARGQGNNNVGFGEIIAKLNNMNISNYAVGGATIRVVNENNILNQISKCNEDGDYILFDGYINDCYDDVLNNLGVYTDYYGSAFDTTKFISAFDETCKQLHLKFKGKKILFVCVHKMGTRDTLIVKQINSLARQILAKWNIPVIDLYNEGILNTYLSDYKIYTNNNDGTHPNQLGYDLYYVPQIESKLKSL